MQDDNSPRWWVYGVETRRQFKVRDAINDLGAYAWAARQFNVSRVPGQRRPVGITAPMQGMAGTLLVKCTDEQWHEIRDVPGLFPTMWSASSRWFDRATEDRELREGVWQRKGDWLRPDGFGAFMERVDADYDERKARYEAGEKVEAYQSGDVLRILAGPLADRLVRLERVVSAADGFGSKLRATMPMLGGSVPVMLDPMDVARVAAE